MKYLLVLSILFVAPSSFAEILEDFDSLGGNDVLLEKVQLAQPETKIQIVQNRIVDRHNRHEFSPQVLSVLGGQSYVMTSGVGVNYNYHITPRWSVGVNYTYNFNRLTPEGQSLIDKYQQDANLDPDAAFIPELDYSKQSYMAKLDWYPIYGKFSFFDAGVVHFDGYLTAGYGQIDLKSKNTDTWTAGAGLGFWWSQHLTSRFEVRYQTYEIETFTGPSALDLTVASISLGYLL